MVMFVVSSMRSCKAKRLLKLSKGGNTSEFYHAEHEKINKEGYNTDGTINKSQMLADMHCVSSGVMVDGITMLTMVQRRNKLRYKKMCTKSLKA